MLRWDPPCLTFPVAVGKPAVQQLRASNSSEHTFTFKVKTTNPKRYSVRPNVGIVGPGQEVVVTVQLPAMKELPSDMQKCKDKFQVLTLQLPSQDGEELMAKPAEAQRAELTNIWAADAAKEAAVDKIRCAFTYDASYRDAPIPEEEPGQAAPYSPETVPQPSSGEKGTPTAGGKTPYGEPDDSADALEELSGQSPLRGSTSGKSPGGRAGSSSAKQLDGTLEASALRESLAEAKAASAKQQERAQQAAAQVASLEKELEKLRAINRQQERSLEQKAKAAGGKPSGGGGFSSLTMGLLFLSGLGAGYLLAPAPRAAPAAAAPHRGAEPVYTPPAGYRKPDEL